MASKQPIVKQIAWASLIPQVAVMAILMYSSHLLGAEQPIIVGAVFYLILSLILRRLIPSNHRKGFKHLKKKEFAKAIGNFELSYEFFQRYSWIDKFRFLTLLSSSRICYREMALLNLAYCYGQQGDGTRSKEYYEKTIEQFPKSEMARSSLQMFESAMTLAQPQDIAEEGSSHR
jgi:tetratricopeptide (TPR) repeat protein